MDAQGGLRCRYLFGTAEFDEARFELRVDQRVIKIEPNPLRSLREAKLSEFKAKDIFRAS